MPIRIVKYSEMSTSKGFETNASGVMPIMGSSGLSGLSGVAQNEHSIYVSTVDPAYNKGQGNSIEVLRIGYRYQVNDATITFTAKGWKDPNSTFIVRVLVGDVLGEYEVTSSDSWVGEEISITIDIADLGWVAGDIKLIVVSMYMGAGVSGDRVSGYMILPEVSIDTVVQAGTQGKIFYLDTATASDIGGAYKLASTLPAGTAETTIVQANTGTSDTLIATFATLVTEPFTTSLPAGTAFRHLHVKTDSITGAARLKVELYKRTSGGVETLLRTGYSPTFIGTDIVELAWGFTDATGYSLNLTDRIVFKVYTARVSGPATVTVTVYFNGMDRVSWIQTTISEGVSLDTLQSVTNRGAVTTLDVTAANFRSNANIYLNYDGADGDSFLYFYEGSSTTGASIKWNNTSNAFDFSHDISVRANKIYVGSANEAYWAYTAGYMKCTGKGVWTTSHLLSDGTIHAINFSGPDADSFLYFFEGAYNGAYLKWNNTTTLFNLSHGLTVTGAILATTTIGGTTITGSTAVVGAELRSNGNIFVNYDGADGDSFLYFYEASSTTGASLKWNNTTNGFVFSHTLAMSATKITGVLDPTLDQDAATKKYVDDTVAAGAVVSTVVPIFPNYRLLNDWTIVNTDEYLSVTVVNVTTQNAYIYTEIPLGCTSVIVTGTMTLTCSAAGKTLTAYAILQRRITNGAWTDIGTVNNAITLSSDTQTDTLALNITGFTLSWVDGAQYRVNVRRTLNSSANVTVATVSIYGVSIN